MSDIDKAFTYLHDSVPQWFKSVAEVEEKIVAMQEELAKAPASRSLPKKRKSGSIESLRDLDIVTEEPAMSSVGRPSPLATRKRKTPSLFSKDAPGPIVRSRSMIVVSYDGQLQYAFEQLVRAIGAGRSMLRKGKMVAKLDVMAALADEDSDEDDTVMSKIRYRHRTGLSSMRTQSPMARPAVTDSSTTPIEVFESTDNALENAQSLCEKAAHLSLREGDCRKELATVRDHFKEVQEATSKEVARIAARKEKEEQEATQTALQEKAMQVSTTPVPESTRLRPIEITTSVPSAQLVSQVVDIEIDDDDDDVSFVMPPIRLTSRA